MGFFFTLLYILAAYLGPTTIFGELAQYHIQIIIVVLALVGSLFEIQDSGLLRIPQTYAIAGLTAAVFLSMAFNGVLGLAIPALLEFVPNAIVFFLIFLNFRTRGRLMFLVGGLFLVVMYITVHGAQAQASAVTESPWVIVMKNSEGESFFRIRGLDFLNDPNDLSQFISGLIPCMFFFWRRGRVIGNVALVFLPVAFLLYAMFLSHSRGGMIALLAAAIIAGRRKIGILPAVVVGGILFIGLSAVGWSGGRDVSAGSGADRMEAWSTGMELIRSHPVFGVGFERFTEYFYITAHNTVVVCTAELGMLGFFFWTMMLVSTVRDVVSPASAQKSQLKIEGAEPYSLLVTHPEVSPATVATAAENSEFQRPGFHKVADSTRPDSASSLSVWEQANGIAAPSSLSENEIRRMCGLMVISLTGFLTAGWFLSRSYTMVLFVNLGIAAAVYRMARERGVAPAPLALGQASKYAGMVAVVLIAAVYVMLRLDHLLPK